MKQIHIQYYITKYAEFILGSFDNKLCLLDFRYRKMRKAVDIRIQKGLDSTYIEKDDAILRQTRDELDEYFKKERQSFDIPLLTIGSDFQKSVWEALVKVPYGATQSYLQLAKDIGNPKAVRAVANANGANAIAIIIPCHRIIGSNGKLTGYAGGLHVKESLLKLEDS